MDSHGQHKLRINLPLLTSFLLRARLLRTDKSQAGDPSIRLTSDSTSTDWWSRSLCGALLLSVIVMLGCTTVVTPLQPGDPTFIPKPDHGLVLGRIHLMWNGAQQRASAPSPLVVDWLITEEKSGTQLHIDHVPVDGPFVLDLPAGSYRLTRVSLVDDILGYSRTALPATFSVRPQECTYLGTWELEMQTKSFAGTMTRQVLDQQELAQRDLQAIIGEETARSLPMVTQLGTSMQSRLVFKYVSTDSEGGEHVETIRR